MKAQIVAQRYAEALFSEAKAQGKSEEVAVELQNLSALYNESEDFRELVKNPLISRAEKQAVLDALKSKGVVGDFVFVFISILISKNRFNALEEIVASLNAFYMEERGEAEAEVTVAAALDDTLKNALIESLGKLTGKKVSVKENVDPSIIGGVIAKVGSSLVDASIKGQLDKMKESLV